MIIGSHLSISGGLEKALLAAESYGFAALGMFVRNQRQWTSAGLSDEQADFFKKTRQNTAVKVIVAHASYLVNLAGAAETREKSLAAMTEDLSRCSRLGIEYLVFHPGSNPDEKAGISLIAAGLEEIFERTGKTTTKILLETTAGQGNCIGHRFEHLAEIMKKCKSRRRLGVCLDTAHIFAAGYDISSPAACEKTFGEFEKILGWDSLKAVHCNDATKDCGCRVDRHAHIGHGKIGLSGFKWLVNCPQMKELPFILETPKGEDDKGRDWDEINSGVLKKMAGK